MVERRRSWVCGEGILAEPEGMRERKFREPVLESSPDSLVAADIGAVVEPGLEVAAEEGSRSNESGAKSVVDNTGSALNVARLESTESAARSAYDKPDSVGSVPNSASTAIPPASADPPPSAVHTRGVLAGRFVCTYGAVVLVTANVIGIVLFLLVATTLEQMGFPRYWHQPFWLLLPIIPFCAASVLYGMDHDFTRFQNLGQMLRTVMECTLRRGLVRVLRLVLLECGILAVVIPLLLSSFHKELAWAKSCVRFCLVATDRLTLDQAQFQQLISDISNSANSDTRSAGYLMVGRMYQHFNQYSKAESAFADAVRSVNPSTPGWRSQTVLALQALASVQEKEKKYKSAEQQLSRAVEIFKTAHTDVLSERSVRILGPFGANGPVALEHVLAQLASVYSATGRSAQANQIYDRLCLEFPQPERFVDGTGKPTSTRRFSRACDFSEGLAAVKVVDSWGYIGTGDKFVIYPRFAEAGPFHNGWASVAVAAGQWQFVNREGRLLNGVFEETQSFEDGLAPVKIEGKWRYIDEQGKPALLNASFEEAAPFSQGLAAVIVNGKHAYIDRHGEIEFTIGCQSIRPFSAAGLAPAQRDGIWGFIDRRGNWAIAPQFEEVQSFEEGLAAVRVRGRWGYIDKSGQYVMAPTYNSATSFNHGTALVQLDTQYKFIDLAGRWIGTRQFSDASNFSEGFAAVQLPKDPDKSAIFDSSTLWQSGYMRRDGSIMIIPGQFTFSRLHPFSNGRARIEYY